MINRGIRAVKAKCHPERPHRAHGLCGACYNRRLCDANPEYYERVKAAQKKYWAKHTDRLKASQRARYRKYKCKSYGITTEQYDSMFSAQNGLCAICKKPQKGKWLFIDHDHATGIVRGLLCNKCNVGLENFREDVSAMKRAIEYLDQGGGPTVPSKLYDSVQRGQEK